MRRRVVSNTPGRERFPLVEFWDLAEGEFGALIASLRSSPIRDALERAIAFEVASQTQRNLESKLLFCHAALEAVIGGLEDHDPLFDRSILCREDVRGNMKEAIGSVLSRFQVSDAISLLVLKKAKELERAPIADLLLQHTARLGVETQDLWPESVGFEPGLRRALKQRNSLFHAARIEDPQEALDNAVRLQVLTERIILLALQWPMEKIGRYHDQPIRRINRGRR